MIGKDILIEYIGILNNNNNSNFTFGERESYIINLVNNEVKNSNEFREFINRLNGSSDKISVIEEYFNSLEVKKSQSDSGVIASVFGIDISKIEHKYLNNGKEIFSFYDVKYGRPVVLENKKDGVSLVEQLKEIQSQNNEYQTFNGERNVQNILEDKAFKDNCELSMIPIEEIWEHLNQLKNLSVDDLKMLNFLIQNSYSLGIVSINIENFIGLDKYGKIYEVYKDKSSEYKIGEPDTASYNQEDIIVSDRVSDSYNESEQNVVLQSGFEDEPNVIENLPSDEDVRFDYLPDDIKDKTIMFYENPNLLNELSDDEREMWKKYVSMYQKKLEQEEIELNKKNSAPKIRRYVKEENSKGYINFMNLMLIISVILILVSFFVILNNR